MQIVVGLGNPGSRYVGTRHNVGFDLVSHLGQRHGIELQQKRFKAQLGTGRVGNKSAILACPQTYMNRSGDSVGPLIGFYKVPSNEVVVVHDELDLPFGVVRVKQGGGHGGHNGLRDLVKKMGSPDFVRVRVGIGRPQGPMDVSAWVLARWSSEERARLEALLDRAADAAEAVLADGVKDAMNRFNGLEPF